MLFCTLSFVIGGVAFILPHTTAHAASGQLGLNVDANEQALVDLGGNNARIDAIGGVTLTEDTNGWPSSDFNFIIDNRYTYGWVSDAVNIDPLKKSTDISGTYKLVFNGKATLTDACDDPAHCGTTIANQTYDAASNTTTADITLGNPSGGVLMILKFTNTQRDANAATGSGITNLHLWRPGYTPGTSQVFTDSWLSSLTNHNWAAFRFMGFTGTNGYGDPATDKQPNNELYPYRLQWNTDRIMPNVGPLYGQQHPGVHGLPWEYVVLIAQITHKDIWINIPVNASDDYVTQLANLFKNGNAFTGNQGVPDDTHIYVEYSNEMWHFGFHQGPWNNQAEKDEIAAGGSNLNYDGSTNDYNLLIRRIGKRTREIGNQFKSVFSDNGTRIRPVVNNANVGYDDGMLKYLKDNYGDVSNSLYAISTTGYYSSADKSSVDAIINGEKASSDTNKQGYQTSRSLADTYGIHSLVYEGGEDEEGTKVPGPLDPTLSNQFGATRDARMQDVELHDIVDNWYGSGGELYMQFGHVGHYSTYGMWGLSDDVTDQSTGKWKGVDQIMGSTPPPTPTNTSTPTPTNTATSTPTSTPPASDWTKCADEGGVCTVNGTAQVRYGANGTYITKTVTDSIFCSNDAFGSDPLPNVVKHCDYQ
ncbi:hypothetical protein KTT_46230 [Tengunoibacter tsumagoiensis]|uniref:Uncharacterized protein n=1 Tax=Tengunoibacter tsumagoiensis TaxID=2014871 RepID=A0A402A6K0_9CHLR|nr:hypothetical protein KTT_46230 [Tengunoibacter tsumagoiensis]